MEIKQIQNVVKKDIIVDEISRNNDNHLICETMRRMGFNIERSFKDVMNDNLTPSFESITRARRKLQQEHPNLKDNYVAQLRVQQEEIYREFSRN